MDFFFAVNTSAYAGSTNLTGTWKGERFDIELDDSFNEIEGHWGNVKYDLDISESFREIEGKIDGVRIEVEWSTSFRELNGTLPCGKFEIDYSDSFHEVDGKICGYKIDIDVPRDQDAWTVAKEIVIDELLYEFPSPTRSQIRQFIYRYMPKRG